MQKVPLFRFRMGIAMIAKFEVRSLKNYQLTFGGHALSF